MAQALPFELDLPLDTGELPYVAFEWIGAENYLGERQTSKIRQRGRNSTSSDFAFRFRRGDGRVQIILGEWKYTEEYKSKACMRYSANGTDRYRIYEPVLNSPYCQILWKSRLPDPLPLFYDPFDQLMWLQLLASEMEHAREMDADVVSVLRIAPKANTDLMNVITSPPLRDLGKRDIHETWGDITMDDRFNGVHTEDLLPVVTQQLAGTPWAEWMLLRYGR